MESGEPTYADSTESQEGNAIFYSTQLNSEGLPSELSFESAAQLLTPAEPCKLKNVVRQYIGIFRRPTNMGQAVQRNTDHRVFMRINVGDSQPISCAPYRTGPKEREIIETHVQEMLDEGLIRPSRSPWSSPIVLVPKPGGKTRFCIDFRKLNSVTVKDVYPLPRIDTLLDTLQGKRYFTLMDMLSGYWNIAMHPNSVDKTALITHQGLYEFLVMPFGLRNAPAVFQRTMDVLLAGLKWTHCLVHLDDVLLF